MKFRIAICNVFCLFFLFCINGSFGACLQDTSSVARDTAGQVLKMKSDSLSQTDSANAVTVWRFDSVFKPYKKFVRNTTVESTTDLTVNKQKISYKTKADFATRYTLNNKTSDGRVFDVSVVKLNTKVETMGLQLQYNSDSTQSDTTSGFAKPLFDLVGKNIRIGVDTTGKILSVDSTGINESVNNVLSSLTLNGASYRPGQNFGLLYDKDVNGLQLGNSWTDSVENESGKTVSKYVVQSMLHNEIILMVQGQIVQNGTFWSGGHAYKGDFSGTQSGKIIIMKDSRLIKQKTTVFNLHGTVHYSDQEIPAAAVSRISENLSPAL